MVSLSRVTNFSEDSFAFKSEMRLHTKSSGSRGKDHIKTASLSCAVPYFVPWWYDLSRFMQRGIAKLVCCCQEGSRVLFLVLQFEKGTDRGVSGVADTSSEDGVQIVRQVRQAGRRKGVVLPPLKGARDGGRQSRNGICRHGVV